MSSLRMILHLLLIFSVATSPLLAFSNPVGINELDQIQSYEIEMESLPQSVPGTNGEVHLNSSVSVVVLPEFNDNEQPLSTKKKRNKLIDWVGRKYSEMHNYQVQNNSAPPVQVLVIPSDHEFFTRPRDIQKITKELGWTKDVEHVSTDSFETSESQEILTVINQLGDKLPAGSQILKGRASANSENERLFGAVMRWALVGGVIGSAILVSSKNPTALMSQLRRAGIPAAVGGTMSGLLQYFKDHVDRYMKYAGFVRLNKNKKTGWASFVTKQFMMTFLWLTIFRLSLWGVGVVEQPDFFTGSTEVLRTAAVTAFSSMRSTIAFNRIFAESAPDAEDTSPRAERVRSKGRRMALSLSVITTLAEVFYQMNNTQWMGDMILWGVTATGAIMLGKIYQQQITAKMKDAFRKIRNWRPGKSADRCSSLLNADGKASYLER